MRRVLRRILITASTFLVLDQVVQYGLLADGTIGAVRVAPFDPPLFSPYQWERLATFERLLARGETPQQFDPDLGWCPRTGDSGDGFHYDARGARATPGDPAPSGPPAVVAVGCSFTRGDEVAAREAWPARVARTWGVDVANLGVGGYGTDQAYLRFQRDGLPLRPREAWLAIVPGTCLRVSTQFSPIERHWAESVAFKPRFVLGPEDRLGLVPTPVVDIEGYVRLMHDQRALLDAIGRSDLWIRRCPSAYAPRGTSWWHYSGTGRLALTFLEHRGREPEPWLEDGASEVRRVLEGVVRGFVKAASDGGVRARVLVLPSREDLRSLRRHGRAYWAGLFEGLRGAGVDVLDLTEALEGNGLADDPDGWAPGGHYGPRAHGVVASAIVAAWPRPEEPSAR